MRKSLLSIATIAAVLFVGMASAHADSREPNRPDGFSLTISPLLLVFPIGELTLEVPLDEDRNMGLAVIGGYGSVGIETSDGFTTETERVTIFELGASFRYYLLGNYSFGMQLGAELMYIGASTTVDGVTGVGDGFSGAPFLGFKIVTPGGFTFDSQLGVAYVFVRANASDGDSESSEQASDIIPLLNLNIGWTF